MLTKLKNGVKIAFVFAVLCQFGISSEIELKIKNNKGEKQDNEFLMVVSDNFKEVKIYKDGNLILGKYKASLSKNGHFQVDIVLDKYTHKLYFLNFLKQKSDLIFRETIIGGQIQTVAFPSRYYFKEK